MRRPTLTLRRKLVLAFAAMAALVALLVGILAYTVTEYGLRAEIDRSLVSAATTLSAGGTVSTDVAPATDISSTDDPQPGGSNDNPRDRNRDEGIIQSQQTISVDGQVTVQLGVRLPTDSMAAQLSSATATAGTRVIGTVTVGERAYRVLTQALGSGIGALQVGRDLSETDRFLEDLAINIGWVGLGVVLAGAAAGWLVARQITRRLTGLTAAAEHVSSTGVLDVDIPSRGDDEVSRLAAAIRSMLAELARSREDQQRLVQDAGHELRTPLTSLRTNVRVLRRFGELSPDSRIRLLDDVDGETRELTHLVNELVELATDQRTAEEPTDLDLAALAERVAELFRRRSGRAITVQATPTAVRVRPRAVERALSNLLENALKFDPTGTEPLLVEVHGGTLAVSDRGPGLGDGDAELIFDRFYRSTSARSLPGSGLGLSIVRDVARAHGGHVFAANRSGGGATIGFSVLADQVLPNSNPGGGRA